MGSQHSQQYDELYMHEYAEGSAILGSCHSQQYDLYMNEYVKGSLLLPNLLALLGLFKILSGVWL